MSKYTSILVIALFLVSILIGCNNPDLSWHKFDNVKLSSSIGDSTNSGSNLYYSFDVFLVDIALPDIKKIDGRAKLLRHDKSKFAIGYEIEIKIDSLKSEDIPDKYKEKRTIETAAGDIEVLPLEEVLYEAFFEFTLMDKDGFEIKTIKSPSHNISSGKINAVTSKTDYLISTSKASLISDMELDVTITKCVSCK